MRVTLVTETFAPQVNGVSRTLGQLVRYLESVGDSVQVVHPDYGAGPTRSGAVPGAVGPVSALPRGPDPVAAVRPGPPRRSTPSARPDPRRHRGDAGLGAPPARRAAADPDRVELPHQLRPVLRPLPRGLGRGAAWRYLRWFHNRTSETYVPSEVTIDDLAARGFERLVLWPRGVDGDLFRPDRPRRAAIRRDAGLRARRRGDRPRQPAGRREERPVPGRRPAAGRRGLPAGQVPDRRRRSRAGALRGQDGSLGPLRRLPVGRRPGRPLREHGPVRLRQRHRDVRQRRARSAGVRPAGGRPPGGRGRLDRRGRRDRDVGRARPTPAGAGRGL